MDSFELNKIIGAILGTLLFVMGVGFVAEAIYHPIEGRGPGYELPEAEGTATAEPEEPAPAADIGTLLAAASVEDGKAAARKCQSCHTFDNGGANGQGPNLWGIVDRPVAGHEGFSYSDAMTQHAADVGTWTYQNLNAFLIAPKSDVPGTKMSFAGVKNDAERADIIAFLSTLSDTPVPFPAPAAAGEPAAAAEAPAAEEPAPAEAATPEPAPAATPTEAPAMAPADANTMAPAPQNTMAPADANTMAPAPQNTMAPADANTMAPAPQNTMAPADANTMAPAPTTTTTTTTAQ